MTTIHTYLIKMATAAALLLVLMACSQEELIDAGNSGKVMLHISFENTAAATTKSTTQTAEGATVDGTTPDELNYNRIEIYYFAEKDNACFYKQAITASPMGDLTTAGLDIPIPPSVIEKQYADAKFSRAKALVIVNTTTSVGVADNTAYNETAPGTLYQTLLNLQAEDMVSTKTVNYPGSATSGATANHPLIMTGETTMGNFDKSSYPVTVKRMAAKILLDFPTTSNPTLDVCIQNTPAKVRMFDNALSGAQPSTYAKDELITTPWININDLNRISIDGTGMGYSYLYVNENLQQTLNNDTRTTLLIRQTFAPGVYKFYQAYICSEEAGQALKDGHIRRNHIYIIKVDHIDDTEGAEQAVNKYTVYYEPFTLNQGYCFFDLYVSKSNTEPITLEIVNLENRFIVQKGSAVTNNATYTDLPTQANLNTIILNDGKSKVATNTRYRIDMRQKPNDITSIDPDKQQDLRKNIPSCKAIYRIKIGSKIVADGELTYTSNNVFYTTSFGGLEFMKYNVGAYTPPTLYYDDSQGYFCGHASSVKIPPTGTIVPNPTYNSETTGQWICPTGFHVVKQSEWQTIFKDFPWNQSAYIFPTDIATYSTNLASTVEKHYMTIELNKSHECLYFPASGYRSTGGVNVGSANRNAAIWFNCDILASFPLWLDGNGRGASSSSQNTTDFPIRCVKNKP